MQQLSLDNLRTFVTIIEQGSFAKAGELLGKTQPAVTLQVKKLEAQLQRKLFVKVGQRYVASTDGEWLYSKAKNLLAQNDEIFNSLNLSSLRGRLRLGIPNEFASTILPEVIGEFSARYPDVSLEVTSALSKDLLSSSKRGEFDLVLALRDGDYTGDGEVIARDPIVWVGEKSKPFHQTQLRLVLAPEGCMYRSRVIEQLKQQTLSWKITYTNADLSGLVVAIQQGLGVTALARSSMPSQLMEIKQRDFPPLGHVSICLFNFDTAHPVISQTLAEFIKARLGVG